MEHTEKYVPVASTAYVKLPLTNGLVSAAPATGLAAWAVIMPERIPVLAADVVNADRQLGPPLPRIRAYLLAAIAPILGVEMPSASPPDGMRSGVCNSQRRAQQGGVGRQPAAADSG